MLFLGTLEALWGAFSVLVKALGCSWRILDAILIALGALVAILGVMLASLGALGLFFGVLGPLGRTWVLFRFPKAFEAILGSPWGCLVRSWDDLYQSWAFLGHPRRFWVDFQHSGCALERF